MEIMSIVAITFDGQIDDFPLLVQSVDNLVADGTRRLVIDLESLPFINSAALGYLVKLHKTMEHHGGEVALCNLRPALRHILEITDLDVVIPAFESLEEAVDYLGGDASGGTDEGEAGVRHHPWR
jgi:anti-anti-sigma factor